MSKKPLTLFDLDVYKDANEIGKRIWDVVTRWNFFAKDTLGKQIVRSADSISLNLCEGYGRFFYKEKKLFYYYSRGSLFETKEALKKANERNLLPPSEFEFLMELMDTFGKRLNSFINSVGASDSNSPNDKLQTPTLNLHNDINEP